MQLKLNKKESVQLFLTRAGVVEQVNGTVAINETIGYVSIQGLFDKIILFPQESQADSSEGISDKRFFAETLEDASEVISSLKSLGN